MQGFASKEEKGKARANLAYSISPSSGMNMAIISISSLSQGDTAITAVLGIVVLSKIDMYVHILFCVLFCVLIPHQQSHKHETGWEIRSVTLRSCTNVNQRIPPNDMFSYFITMIRCGMSVIAEQVTEVPSGTDMTASLWHY